ncbi:hypothetical protein [Natrinema ejinorense]|uniref:Uncharacterized protein n=1 Tax=Natrinema ejinorense TaxID=373386 RepID=A0A2A5QT18_9EURY|nr:hypothetical protein [Natrinema ejinorense]PCR89955.1 hypothetical protein CP557_05035 [Natrinema ejinorense]
MDIEASRPIDRLLDGTALKPVFFLFVLLPTVLGAVHHVDHIVRGNHLGWPFIQQVTPFTYSLAIYPLVALSLSLTLRNRVDAGYWTGFFAFSAAMIASVHISPWAIEPPRDVIAPYANPVVGLLAFAVLLGLIASVGLGCAYAAVRWHRVRS